MDERETFYINTAEAAAILGIHPATVLRQAKSGNLPVAYTVEDSRRVIGYRFTRASIVAERERRSAKATACGVEECRRPVRSNGWCNMHHQRWLKHGDPRAMARKPYARGPLEVRFWTMVNKTPTCWLWTGKLNAKGYGSAHLDATTSSAAHRVAYELVVGPIPDGLEIDHLCVVRSCVNPAHLEAVTHAENIRRGYARRAQSGR